MFSLCVADPFFFVAVVSNKAFVVSYLFLISPSFGASGGLCFVIMAFPGYFYFFFYPDHIILKVDGECS